MRKKENGKEKQVNLTGKIIWIAAVILNVIPITSFTFLHI